MVHQNGAGDWPSEPTHPFTRRLYWALQTTFAADMRLCLRVGVMLANGCTEERIARKLDVRHADMKAAIRRIERCLERLERDDEDVPTHF